MAEGKIYEAISAVMADVGAVGKDKVNQLQKYNFRGIDDVMNALNPAMVKHKVFVAPEVLEEKREERTTGKGGLLIYSILKVKFTFYTVDGSSVEATVIGEAMDSGDKSMNKAMSAAFKYACFQTFCIPTEEMKDSEIDSPEPAPKVEEKKDNPDLTPHGEGMTSERLEKIHAEMDRTGINEKTILGMFKVKKLEDMTEAQYVACMNKFEKTANKA